MELIDKAVIVARIEEEIKEIDEIGTYLSPKGVLTNLLCHLDTFEVKEVDLNKEIMKYQREIYDRDTTVRDVAKHFFNLGLKAREENKL